MAPLQIVVVTGMSGAGRTSALRVLEDLGHFCIDNLPPQLARDLVELISGDGQERTSRVGGEIQRVGLGVDVRTGSFFEGSGDWIDELQAAGHSVDVLFLDSVDDVLMRRYSESRRPHPLAQNGDVLDAIAHERARLAPIRLRAQHVIDTTRTSVHELRRLLIAYLDDRSKVPFLSVRFISFGFKYGLPVDADMVFDVRFLSNPHFVPELRPLSGMDFPVADYVLSVPEARQFLADVRSLLEHTLPQYEREGKSYLTIAIGCTGGRHRSVALVEELGKWLREKREVVVAHRDVNR